MAAKRRGGPGTFLNPEARGTVDPRRCRVCGHLTLTPVRRASRALLWAIIGALSLYIALDVFENGALDGGVYRALRHDEARPAPQRIVP
jgi:hypothetical protein